jgi:hypothetical protein
MDLWTEYEGATIDSAYPLDKLLQTEGRSAFFITQNTNGESVLIRIIECHFDEDEILARWRGVQSLEHPNFLNIDRFGQFEIPDEKTTAVYAVLERVDGNLGEVLERGCLSKADAAEIGHSVACAIETLHSAGFVHEHVEPRNIYSSGDLVKLRCDCIRETPEGPAGVEARRKDVHDLANLLIQVLLGPRRASAASQINLLPAPYDEMVRNGINGSWSLAEMKAALGDLNRSKSVRRKEAPPKPAPAPPKTGAAEKVPPAASAKPQVSSVLTAIISPAATANGSAKSVLNGKPATPANETKKVFEDPELFDLPAFASTAADNFPRRKPAMEVPVIFGISEQDFRKWTTISVLVLGAVLIGWLSIHLIFGHSTNAAANSDAPQQSAVADSHPAATPKTITSPASSPASDSAHLQAGVQWRVVVFTYKSKEQAEKKVSSLAHEHPELAPAVFSPMNRAPWLVTIGGVLDRDKAYELAHKARSLGLPRDAYAQNYKIR